MNEVTTGYANSPSSMVLGTFANLTFTTTTTFSTIENVTRQINNISSWETNIHEVNSTKTFTNLTTEKEFSKDPDCT